MFPDLKQDGNVPNAGTESGPGRGCSRMPGTFLGKYLVPGKWRLGTQTSRGNNPPKNLTCVHNQIIHFLIAN